MKDILNNSVINTILNIIKGITSTQQLHFNYWFRNPGPTSLISVLPELIFFALLIFAGIAILVYNRWKIGYYPPKNKLFKPAGIELFILGIFGLIFTLIRSQGVTFLGVRFFLLALFAVTVGWVLYFTYLYRKHLPKEMVDYEARSLKQKYFTSRPSHRKLKPTRKN